MPQTRTVARDFSSHRNRARQALLRLGRDHRGDHRPGHALLHHQQRLDLDGGSCGLDDEFVLIGRQGDEEITATDWAARLGTINYEIVTDNDIFEMLCGQNEKDRQHMVTGPTSMVTEK